MVLLKISYRVQAHNIPIYDEIWSTEVLPLIKQWGFKLPSIWRTVIGAAGEYLELWQFDSITDFETRWQSFMADAALLTIFQKTGPLVLDEQLTILEPLHVDKIKFINKTRT